MILAGRTWRVTLADGRTFDVTPTPGDEVRFERSSKTSLTRLVGEGGVPLWVIIGIVHTHLTRTGADVPTDLDEFADLMDADGLEVVDEGKAEASDPTPPTG